METMGEATRDWVIGTPSSSSSLSFSPFLSTVFRLLYPYFLHTPSHHTGLHVM